MSLLLARIPLHSLVQLSVVLHITRCGCRCRPQTMVLPEMGP